MRTGSITPLREERAQRRDLFLGGHELGISTLPEQSERAEGNLLFLGVSEQIRGKEPVKLYC